MDGSRGGAIQGVFSNADNENENAANFMMADGGSGGQNYGGGRYKNEQVLTFLTELDLTVLLILTETRSCCPAISD
jgi:hypothetical protein